MSAANRSLRIALAGSNGLITAAQTHISNYLEPGGYSPAELIDRLIELFDGPQQRKVQTLSEAALAGRMNNQWKTHFKPKELVT